MDSPASKASSQSVPYRTAEAFRAAVTDRIATVASPGPYTVNQLRRQFAYDRLLTRIFATDEGYWILKGAGALLARIPGHARHSLDVDLFHQGKTAAAIGWLQELGADGDFGDYFTFDITAKTPRSSNIFNVELSVVAYLGEREFERFKIDLVGSSNMTASPQMIDPIHPIDVPGLPVASYRVYPLVDHIADKHAAMLETHSATESTRFRDLVDLVVIAGSQRIEAKALRTAMMTEYTHRNLTVPTEVTLPSNKWIAGYERAAKNTPNLTHSTATEAIDLVGKMLNPVLAGRDNGTWNPATAVWED